ncbi:hypothetical protein AABM17_225 [Neisseria musculi]|uniref:Uncharacterized protein n=1 Tax=Neisseria musculi TaxID=1815583 RepID=A0A7H1M971_9NEIS|nr:hypothetical protein H7A79_0224 [Neisseria musculi]
MARPRGMLVPLRPHAFICSVRQFVNLPAPRSKGRLKKFSGGLCVFFILRHRQNRKKHRKQFICLIFVQVEARYPASRYVFDRCFNLSARISACTGRGGLAELITVFGFSDGTPTGIQVFGKGFGPSENRGRHHQPAYPPIKAGRRKSYRQRKAVFAAVSVRPAQPFALVGARQQCNVNKVGSLSITRGGTRRRIKPFPVADGRG